MRSDTWEKTHPELKHKIQTYFENDCSTISPNRTYNTHFNEAGERKAFHKTCTINCKALTLYNLTITSMKQGYNQFISDFPLLAGDVTCKRFASLKPDHCVKRRMNTCCCPQCMAQHRMREAYYIMARDQHTPKAVTAGTAPISHLCDVDECVICNDDTIETAMSIYPTSAAVKLHALCHRPDNETQYKYACAHGTCPTCRGDDGKFPLAVWNVCELAQSTRCVQFTQWTPTDLVAQDKHGNEKTTKSVGEAVVTMAASDMTALFEDTFIKFLPHTYASGTSAEGAIALIDHLKFNSTLLLIDYGMNYSAVHVDDAQAEFFNRMQTTVLPIVMYVKDAAGEVWAESFTFISPDMAHDNAMVRHAIKWILALYKQKHNRMFDNVIVLSDGASAHFKSKEALYFISQQEIEIPVLGINQDTGEFDQPEMCASSSSSTVGSAFKTVQYFCRFASYFWASSHGKGGSDAETAVAKQTGAKLEQSGKHMADSLDFYKGIKSQLQALTPHGPKNRHSLRCRRVVWVAHDAVLRVPVKFGGLNGQVKRNHSFRSTGVAGMIEHRQYICSCDWCTTHPCGVTRDDAVAANLMTMRSCTRREYNEDSQIDEIVWLSGRDNRAAVTVERERQAAVLRRLRSVKHDAFPFIVAIEHNTKDPCSNVTRTWPEPFWLMLVERYESKVVHGRWLLETYNAKGDIASYCHSSRKCNANDCSCEMWHLNSMGINNVIGAKMVTGVLEAKPSPAKKRKKGKTSGATLQHFRFDPNEAKRIRKLIQCKAQGKTRGLKFL